MNVADVHELERGVRAAFRCVDTNQRRRKRVNWVTQIGLDAYFVYLCMHPLTYMHAYIQTDK